MDSSTAEKSLYKSIRELPEGDAEYLIMELQLPKLVCFVLLWLCNASSIARNGFSLKIIFATLRNFIADVLRYRATVKN